MPTVARLRRANALARPSWRAFSSARQSRANLNRNNSGQGVVAGSPGTVPTNWAVTSTGGVFTRTIIGVGTEEGIDYLETRIQASGSGTFTFQFEGGAFIAAASGQTLTNSMFVKAVAGSLTNISEIRLGISENDSGGVFLAGSTTAFTPTSAGLSSQRWSHVRALNNASTAFAVGTQQVVFSGAGDITLRHGWPMLHLGAVALSPIRTSGVARVGVFAGAGR